jgi:hypothetical protein
MKIMRLAAVLALLCGVTRADAQGPAQKQYYGTFDSVEGGKVHMTLNDKSTGEWTVAPDAQVVFAKQPKTMADVTPGERGYVWVSEDGVIHKIQLVSMKPTKKAGGTAATPGKATRSGASVQKGKVTSVAGGNVTVALDPDAGTMTFGASDLAGGIKLTYKGAAKHISDVRVGAEVSIISSSPFVVTEIKILSMPGGAAGAKTGGAASNGGCPAGSTMRRYGNEAFTACLADAGIACPAAYPEFANKNGIQSCGHVKKPNEHCPGIEALDAQGQMRCEYPECGKNVALVKDDNSPQFRCVRGQVKKQVPN